jgi:lysosomal acid lipase/cholesteryl ester hydrolase
MSDHFQKSLFSTILQLVHLLIVIIVLLFSHLFKSTVISLYYICPWKEAIDSLYFKHPFLRSIFTYKLNSTTPSSLSSSSSLSSLHSSSSSSTSIPSTAAEMIRAEGFDCEEHIVHTPDGYILVLHRIVLTGSTFENKQTGQQSSHQTSRLSNLESTLNLEISNQERSREAKRSSHQRSTNNNNERGLPPLIPIPPMLVSLSQIEKKTLPPAVLCLHGLMMSSDSFVISGSDSLAFVLFRAGFDVWLGNLRGNRYTSHDSLSPSSNEYWNFSLDEFARYDVPSMIEYILKHTKKTRVSLVGFSQGSASTFASLVSVPDLQSSIACFAALAPAIAIKGISHEGFASLLRVDPSFLYLLFGQKSFLSLVLDVQRILSPKLFVSVMDHSMHFLFGWTTKNMENKERLYTALVGLTSVTNVVHWMEIVRSNIFATKQRHSNSNSSHYISINYDTKRIQPPLALFFGTNDTLIDVPRLVRSLPPFSRPEMISKNRAGEVLFQRESGGPLVICKVHRAVNDVLEEEEEVSQRSRGVMLKRSAKSSILFESTCRSEEENSQVNRNSNVIYERHPLLLFEVPELEHLDLLWGTKHNIVFPALVQFLTMHS